MNEVSKELWLWKIKFLCKFSPRDINGPLLVKIQSILSYISRTLNVNNVALASSLLSVTHQVKNKVNDEHEKNRIEEVVESANDYIFENIEKFEFKYS